MACNYTVEEMQMPQLLFCRGSLTILIVDIVKINFKYWYFLENWAAEYFWDERSIYDNVNVNKHMIT